MIKLFSYLKGLAIIRWGLIAIKNLWPFLLAFIFWPEIDSLMRGFSWWRDYCATFSQYIIDASSALREVPVFGPVFEFIDESWSSIRQRLIQLLA